MLIAAPAAASADTVTFGVDVDATGPATYSENHQADVLYFNPKHQANSHSSPVDGEVVEVRVKGTIDPRVGLKRSQSFESLYRLWHIQTLRPESNGSFTVKTSSDHLYFPVEVDPNTVTSFRASHPQCVQAGDVIDFNNIGGWDGDMGDPHGTTYKIFGEKPGNEVWWYERDAGTFLDANFLPNRRTDNGNNVTHIGSPIPNKQLLMEVTVATGYDSAVNCPGGRKGQEYQGVSISTPEPTPKVYDDGIARARVFCPGNTKTACAGSVKLESEGQVLAQSDSFKLEPTAVTNVKFKLTDAAANLLAQRGTIDAAASSLSYDGYEVGKTTNGTVRLISARPAVTGFAGTQARAQTITVKKATVKKLTLKATCPAGTQGGCSGKVNAQTQQRIKLRASQKRGNLYKMASGAFTIASGKSARFPIKLTSAGLKVLKAKKTVVAIAQLDSKDGAGRPHVERVKVTFKYSGK